MWFIHVFPDSVVESDDGSLEDVGDCEDALPSSGSSGDDGLGDAAEVLFVGVLEQGPRREAGRGGRVEGIGLALQNIDRFPKWRCGRCR